MTPETAHSAHASSLQPSRAPDFAMILKAAEHGRGWDHPWSGSVPWTAVRTPSQVEANRTMLSETTRSDTFEQLALPLFPSLYNHAFWLTRNQAEGAVVNRRTHTRP